MGNNHKDTKEKLTQEIINQRLRLTVAVARLVSVAFIVKRYGKQKPIRSFQDLEVYQTAYQVMLEVFRHVLPKLPAEERYDLVDQLRRSIKAVPRLIAEGHSKRHQKKGFQKYLDDAMAESNETIVSLTQAKDIYSSLVDVKMCERLIDIYDKISRQCYNLALAWDKFSERKSRAQPKDGTRNE